MNKDDLIDILIDWVEEDKKVDTDIGHFIDIEDITSICGGGWIGLNEDRTYNTWVKMEKYVKIKEDISKNGWDTSKPSCVLSFVKPTNKNDENLIGYIIVRGGNHRIVMTKKNKLKNKIYTKFMFNNDSNIDKIFNGQRFEVDTKGNCYHPYLKKIYYELQEGK